MGKFGDFLKEIVKPGKQAFKSDNAASKTKLGKTLGSIFSPRREARKNSDIRKVDDFLGGLIKTSASAVAPVAGNAALANVNSEKVETIGSSVGNMFGTSGAQSGSGLVNTINTGVGNIFGTRPAGGGNGSVLGGILDGSIPFSVNSGNGGLQVGVGAPAAGNNLGQWLQAFLPIILFIGFIWFVFFKKK